MLLVPTVILPKPLKIVSKVSDLKSNKEQKPKNLEGYIFKRSGNFLVGWQIRWCRLQDKILCYFEKQSSLKPNGILNFDQLSISLKVHEDKPEFS